MGILDEKTKKKIDEELAFDRETADTLEEELMDNLGAIGDEYVDTERPKKEDFAVDEENFDYIDYRDKSERELKNEALKNAGRYDKKDFSDKYVSEKNEFAEAAKDSTEEFRSENAKSRRDFDEAVKNIIRYAKRNGLADSSIQKMLVDDAAAEMGKGNEASAEKLSQRLKKIGENLDKIESNEKADAAKDEQVYNNLLEKELKQITGDYDKEKSDADKVDAATAKAEEAYKKSVEKAKKDYEKAVGEYVNRKAEREEKYGYEGEKKKNYEKKFEAAKEYYINLPKEEALRRIRRNMPLKNELGHLYASLLQSVMAKEE